MGTGPLSSNLAECGGLFLNTDSVHVTPTHYLTFPKSTNSAWMSIGVNLTQPRSQGSLQLSSANPMDPPKIDADYLHCEEDLEQMIRGVEYVREITKSKDLEKVITSEALPGKKRSTSEAIGKSILRYAQPFTTPWAPQWEQKVKAWWIHSSGLGTPREFGLWMVRFFRESRWEIRTQPSWV